MAGRGDYSVTGHPANPIGTWSRAPPIPPGCCGN